MSLLLGRQGKRDEAARGRVGTGPRMVRRTAGDGQNMPPGIATMERRESERARSVERPRERNASARCYDSFRVFAVSKINQLSVQGDNCF